MGGKDDPQGAGGSAQPSFLGAVPVGHQSQEQLVGPGDAQGRSEALPWGPEGRHLSLPAPGPSPTPTPTQGPAHPSGPRAESSSMASVTWKVRGGSAAELCPEGPAARAGWAAHLVDAEHRAPEGLAEPTQGGPQRLQSPGPARGGLPVELAAERGCHGVEDDQAGHAPRQQYGHLLAHTLQQPVLQAQGQAVTSAPPLSARAPRPPVFRPKSPVGAPPFRATV